MSGPAEPLRFGLFIAPHHDPRENPTLALERDVDLIQHIERIGFDEVWVGEHHSAGWEYIGSPELFLAHVAARTSRIKLATGMVTLPYHNPLWSLERMVLLDHLSRGRAIFGVGPGSLPTDAAMIGLDPRDLRPRLEEAVDAVMRLLRSDEPVTMKTDWFTLEDAALQLRPYTYPHFELAVAAVASPAGPRVAGKHGLSLVSIGATMKDGFDALAMHWDVMEEQAAHYGSTVDRSGWRLVGPMHIAATREQARREVAHGIEGWFHFMKDVSAVPQFALAGDTVDEMIDFFVEGGAGVIGTVDDAIEQIERLREQSKGFGTYLVMGNNWATPADTKRSLELIAERVIPVFRRPSNSLAAAEERAFQRHDELFRRQELALAQMNERHAAERAERAKRA
ncbi:LLM class flavin-dependent oxidoreductase [Actinomadura vinacea]|uniref:LLM class flavin-dependent oxidoreductase n=1 Tax=Actinomadura vinacea TaxID=115336 RepID=A0ABN3IIY4_9ACTN